MLVIRKEIIASEKPSLVFTATSSNGVDWERYFIKECIQKKIPTVSLLDTWINYRARFTNGKNNPLLLPDQIAVMDQKAKDEMIEEGIPGNHITITGQPVYDEFILLKKEEKKKYWKFFRESHDIKSEDLVITFVSQPLRSSYDHIYDDENYLGYNEQTVLDDLVKNLEKLKRSLKQEVHLVIRLHPKEGQGTDLVVGDNINCPVHYDFSRDNKGALLASNVIVGMHSNLLIEASYMGKKVISYRPNAKQENPLKSNETLLWKQAGDRDKLLAALKQGLQESENNEPRPELLTGFGATSKVADLVMKLCASSKRHV